MNKNVEESKTETPVEDTAEHIEQMRELNIYDGTWPKSPQAICLICANTLDIDQFKTALNLGGKPFNFWEIHQPAPPSEDKTQSTSHHYTIRTLETKGVGVCFSCSESIRIMKKAASPPPLDVSKNPEFVDQIKEAIKKKKFPVVLCTDESCFDLGKPMYLKVPHSEEGNSIWKCARCSDVKLTNTDGSPWND